jgi:hypothetical protein
LLGNYVKAIALGDRARLLERAMNAVGNGPAIREHCTTWLAAARARWSVTTSAHAF